VSRPPSNTASPYKEKEGKTSIKILKTQIPNPSLFESDALYLMKEQSSQDNDN
jgi:hypothetical protein